RVVGPDCTVHHSVASERAQPTIVEFHHPGKNASRHPFKRELKKRLFRIAISWPNESDEVTADIEQERGRHQIGFAHVEVLVLVKGFEPGAISDRELFVIVTPTFGRVLPP